MGSDNLYYQVRHYDTIRNRNYIKVFCVLILYPSFIYDDQLL